MFKSLKLIFIISILCAVQSQAMLLRTMRGATPRASVTSATRLFPNRLCANQTRLAVTVSQPKISIKAHPMFIQLQHQDKKKNDQYRSNFNKSQNFKRLIGTGAALTALYAGASVVQADGKEQSEVAAYKPPFEEQCKKYYAELLKKPWGEVAKKYIEQFEKEENELMKEIFETLQLKTALEITPELKTKTVEEMKDLDLKCREYFLNREQEWIKQKLAYYPEDPIEPRVKIRIYNFLKQFEIDDQITIVPSNDTDFLEAGLSTIRVGDECFKNHPFWQNTDAGKFFLKDIWVDSAILHEIQHILQADYFKLYIFGLFATPNFPIQIDQKKLEKCVLKYRILAEKRADVLAGLMEPKFAIGLAEYFLYILRYPSPWYIKPLYAVGLAHEVSGVKASGHASYTERSIYMKQLHKEMIEAIKNNQKSN